MAGSGHAPGRLQRLGSDLTPSLAEVLVVASRSRLAVLVAGLSLVAGGLLLGGAAPSQAIPGAKVFPGTGFGAIADGGVGCAPSAGAPRDVTFAVTGMGAVAPADVRVTGLSLTHSYVGDLTVTLIAPNGTQQPLFGRTGALVAAGFGDSSNLAGPYDFADDAAGGWWASATAVNDTTPVAAGAYRTTQVGGAGADPNGTTTELTSAFAGVTHPNGTWTLRFVDTCDQNTGTVTAATLELVPGLCAFQAETVEVAQPKVASANAAVPTASAAAAAADQVVLAATKPVAKVTKAVTKAKQALKAAKKSGNAAAIAKATQTLKKAKAKLKAAKAVLASAQQAAVTAHQKLAAAQATAAAAQAELAVAQAALQACVK
jgi:subtilisin-like proprotein convertase family protein